MNHPGYLRHYKAIQRRGQTLIDGDELAFHPEDNLDLALHIPM